MSRSRGPHALRAVVRRAVFAGLGLGLGLGVSLGDGALVAADAPQPAPGRPPAPPASAPPASVDVPPCAAAAVLVSVDGSTGSGSVIDPLGFVLTNYHVVAPVLVEGFDGPRIRGGLHARIQVPDLDTLVATETFEVELVAASRALDLALVRVVAPPRTPFATMALAPSGVAVTGETVSVLGYPFGHPTLTVLRGAVTSRRVRADDVEWLTIDAPFNPGNSGGAVVDDACRLVAVPTQVFRGGISPVSMARPLAPEVRAFLAEALARATTMPRADARPAFDRARPAAPKEPTPGARRGRGGRR